MSKDESPQEVRKKSLDYSVKDGAAFSVMTGFGEQYFSPLAIELGASNMQIGLLASVPLFIASVWQLYTTRFVEYLKSRRRVITSFVFLQALTWIPLALLPLWDPQRGVFLLIALVMAYFILGQFVAPVWSSLIGDLVDERERGKFFGMRNKVTGAVAFLSLFAAGLILSVFPKNQVLHGYALIFAVAFLARLASWRYLKKSEDPPATYDKKSEFSFRQYLGRLPATNYGKFALYFALMSFSVNIAGPFFTVYMLRDLRMGYLDYTVITAAAALTSFLAMTYWGVIADKFGNKRVLKFSGLFVSTVPILWLFSGDVAYLVLVQVFSGFVWAGFNLSTANFMFDNVKPGNRTRVFSYHNVLTGTLVFGGAVLGGLLSKVLTSPWIFYSSLQILFLISGLLRAAVSFFFLPFIKEVREVEQITDRDFFIRYSGTGPVAGLTFKAVTGLQHSLTSIGVRWVRHKTPLR